MEKQGKVRKPTPLEGFSSGLWIWEDRKAELMFEATVKSVSRRMNSINCRRQEEITWGFEWRLWLILLHEEVTPQKSRGLRVGKNLISFLSPVLTSEMDLTFKDLNRNQNLDRAKLGEGKR